MSHLIATKRVDLLAPYLALDQGSLVQAECECGVIREPDICVSSTSDAFHCAANRNSTPFARPLSLTRLVL